MASAAGLGLIGLTVSVLEAHVGRVALTTSLSQQAAASGLCRLRWSTQAGASHRRIQRPAGAHVPASVWRSGQAPHAHATGGTRTRDSARAFGGRRPPTTPSRRRRAARAGSREGTGRGPRRSAARAAGPLARGPGQRALAAARLPTMDREPSRCGGGATAAGKTETAAPGPGGTRVSLTPSRPGRVPHWHIGRSPGPPLISVQQ